MVYRLRRLGERLPTDEVRAGGMLARFVLGRHPVHPAMRASLFDPATGRSLADLECAQIKQVRDDGFLVAGFGLHPGRAGTRQTWWCVPTCAGQNGRTGSCRVCPHVRAMDFEPQARALAQGISSDCGPKCLPDCGKSSRWQGAERADCPASDSDQ